MAKTLFEHHPRYQYTWNSPNGRNKESNGVSNNSPEMEGGVKDVKTHPGADCISDLELLSLNLTVKA